MAFTLYNAPQSTCSQRVRFVLNAKGLPFEEVKLDLLAGDQLKPDYLKLNPNGVVPTLDHDGSIVIDSTVIIAENGTVQNIQLVDGPPELVPSAMDAVKQWIYTPVLLNGKPVEVITQIDVNYTLSQ